MSQSLVSDGLQSCDASSSEKAIQTILNFSEQNSEQNNESSPSEFENNPSHPSHPLPVSNTATTQTITNNESTRTNPSQTPQLLLKMIKVWTDIIALGEIVLAATPEELQAAVVTFTQAQSDCLAISLYSSKPDFSANSAIAIG
jgi:hypothetical protein